jgi:hypothetical protein
MPPLLRHSLLSLRDLLLAGGPFVLLGAALPWVACVLCDPAPPRRVVPPLYAFRVRSRIFRWYGRPRGIEAQTDAPAADRARLLCELDALELRVGQITVPLSHADELYALRSHIHLVRGRLRTLAGGEAK